MNLRSAARAAALLSAGLSALGAVQPSCGRTVIYVEPSACASLNELACRERIDCKAVYGGGSADGRAEFVRCAVVGASCPGSICDACPEGTKPILDSAGCNTCQCQGEKCPVSACGACPEGTKPVLDPKGCDTCRCTPSTCGPVCTIACPNGNVLDADGCPICQCKPAACPAPKPCPLCVTGYVADANGCQTCECAPGIACDSDADCRPDLSCQPDPTDPCNDPAALCVRPGRHFCLPRPTCTSHAECPAGHYCTVVCEPGKPCITMLGQCQPVCRADADCSSGQTCQPDPTDPCNSDPTIQCFAPGRRTCQPAPTACGGPPSYRDGYRDLRSTVQEHLQSGWCKVAQTCGGVSFVDCHSDVDGPAYYVDSATGCVLEECGGACMAWPETTNLCQACPPPEWSCR